MFQVYFGRNAPICQVEGFDEACERSCRGSLHVRPNTVLSMTEGELAHLNEAYPHLLLKARVIASPPKALVEEKAKEGQKELSESVTLEESPSVMSAPAEEEESFKRGRRKSS